MQMQKNKWILNAKQRCDLEMLLIGGFNPLSGFLTQKDYEQVIQHCRLADGRPWPMPITLDVSDEFAASIEPGDEIALCDNDNSQLASMRITDKWKADKQLEAQAVFGTHDLKHPGVANLLNK